MFNLIHNLCTYINNLLPNNFYITKGNFLFKSNLSKQKNWKTIEILIVLH